MNTFLRNDWISTLAHLHSSESVQHTMKNLIISCAFQNTFITMKTFSTTVDSDVEVSHVKMSLDVW